VTNTSTNSALPAQSAVVSRLMEQMRGMDKTVVGKSSAAADRDAAEQQILMATRTPTRPKTARKYSSAVFSLRSLTNSTHCSQTRGDGSAVVAE
jgi:hypothetical protein